MDIQGRPINPVSRLFPDGLILTGIGAIDLMNSIAIGHEYTIYSATGLPHNDLVAQIIRQATLLKPQLHVAQNFSDDFTIVFAGIGVSVLFLFRLVLLISRAAVKRGHAVLHVRVYKT